jgi:hypothetical protein
MSEQNYDTRKANRNRPWDQVAIVSILVSFLDVPSIEAQVEAQVSEAVENLLAGKHILLPGFMQKEIEISMQKAVLEYFSNDWEESPIPSSVKAAVVRVFMTDLDALPGMVALTEAGWGYFLVQKLEEQDGSTLLFVDLYLYQE